MFITLFDVRYQWYCETLIQFFQIVEILFYITMRLSSFGGKQLKNKMHQKLSKKSFAEESLDRITTLEFEIKRKTHFNKVPVIPFCLIYNNLLKLTTCPVHHLVK